MSRLYLELFDKERREVFQKLIAFSREGALAGGTAIALQLNHRYSYDFDVFLEKEEGRSTRGKAKKIFGFKEILIDQKEQLTFIGDSGIKLTFLSYPYHPLHKKIPTRSIPLFHLKDLATDKASVIGRRGQWRDYIDFFFLLKTKMMTLSGVIREAKKRFGGEFSEKLFLEQLSYYGDIHDFGADFVSKSYSAEEIQSFLKNEVKRFKRVLFAARNQ